jgi:transcriptional regulator
MVVLTNGRLFNQMIENSAVTNSEMKRAYEEFVAQVITLNESGNTHSEIYRMLNNTRIELVFLQSLNRYKQEKKCAEIRLSSQSYLAP